MAKDNEPLGTPKRRFSEFREPWAEKTLGDYLVESRIPGSDGFTARKLTVKLWGKGVYEKVEAIRGSENTQYYKRRAGQFIYSKLDFLNQAFGIIPEHLDGFESTVDLPCFDVAAGLDARFLVEYVQRPNFYRKHGDMADGGRKAKRIQVESFLSFPVAVPTPAEQRKIATCLAWLDELITAQSRKVETLKAHKRGLTQQLFPCQDEVVPRLRFPEFRSTLEWEEHKAGHLFDNKILKGEKGLPIYSVTIHDGMVRRDSFDRNFYDIEDPAGNKKARKNDIAYNMMRMWQGAVGIAPEDCLVSPAYVVLSPQKGVVSRFFEYLFKLPATLILLTSHSRGLTKDRLRLYYDDFARIPLRIPSQPEQMRIAECLSTLDARIAAEADKFAALIVHKRGLMQQLFPSPEDD